MKTPQTGGCATPYIGERSRKLIAESFPIFTEAVLERLEMGAQTYGDSSLDLDSARLLVEIEQEMLDVMGWGFILFARIQKLKAKMQILELRANGSV